MMLHRGHLEFLAERGQNGSNRFTTYDTLNNLGSWFPFVTDDAVDDRDAASTTGAG